MKKILLVLFCSLILLPSKIASQNKINPAGRQLLQEFKLKADSAKSRSGQEIMEEPSVSAIVLLKESADEKVLQNFDVEIQSSLDGVIVASCPISVCEQISELPEVLGVSFGSKSKAMLDFARPASNVTDIQDGFKLDDNEISFNGKGVICGMFDTGLDANHINFVGNDGRSRIQRLWHMTGSDGTATEYTPSTISNFTTDNTTGSHATHVAGILGGGYKGEAKYGYLTTATGNTGSIIQNGKIPYYGVATNSDLCFGVGALYDANVLQGLTNIIEYSQSVGKPAVINLSIGSNIGPHDGTDVYTQSISRLAKNAIICIAAGNEGDSPISVSKKITSATGNNAFLRTFPIYMDDYGDLHHGVQEGIVDLWSSDNKPITFALKVFKGDVSKAETIAVLSSPGSFKSNGNSVFNSYFNGSVTIQMALDPNNNRYEVYTDFDNVSLKRGVSNVGMLIEASGEIGTEFNMFGNGIAFDNRSTSGSATTVACTKGNGQNSISNLACAKNIISVGSYTTRTTWLRLDGSVYGYNSNSGFTVGQVSPFSSYGIPFGGTEYLPLICAPGANIVSSYSKYLVNSTTKSSMIAEATQSSSSYYWGTMQGTSMACPYTTGTIGLWLQADQTLTYSDVIDVIKQTAIASPFGTSSALKKQWGGGKLDALAGIKEVLRRKGNSGIGNVMADGTGYVIEPAGRGVYNVMVDGAASLTARVYNVQGVAVAEAQAQGNELTIDVSGMANGVYIMVIEAPNMSPISKKIALQ